MDFSVYFPVLVAISLALFFCFTNGFNDSANQAASVIASHAMPPGKALTIAAIGNFLGALFLGTSVAETMGRGIVNPGFLSGGKTGAAVIIAALIGAICWNIISWYFGLPSSSSHSLIGGLLGAFVAAWGATPINWLNVFYIIVIMVISPFVGFILTYVVTKITFIFSRWFTPSVNNMFKKFQLFSLTAQALSHGTNDGQKTMGVIVFVLAISGLEKNAAGNASFAVPFWVAAACAGAIALGTLAGGWRIIKKLGMGLYKIRPIHAFASQATSSIVLYVTAIFGYPISTTQVMSSSIMGAGAAFRFKMVRWTLVKDMMLAWFVTIPVSGFIAATCLVVFRKML